MNINHESHAISRRSFLKASGVVGAAGILAACGGGSSSSTAASASSGATSAPQHHRRYSAEGVHLLGEHQP